jgi:phosphoglycerol transferase MdoB-like AlkP superfamily enzyme
MFEDLSSQEHDLLTKERPNIVLILLESWSANALGCLGGEAGITPGFDSLAKQGILFTDFYSSGFRTEQGLVAVLCGFPAQPQSTIIRKFGKFERLENLVMVLNQNGYQSSYYYSGDLNFANTGTFLQVSGFDIIYGEKNFKANRRTRWGAYDEELFDFHLKDSLLWKDPFFSVIMTSTSHEPFTGDVTPVRKPVDEASIYLNTVHYTDSCLYDYMTKASSTSWFKNTLFIITADHGHYNPYNSPYNSPERHHIPLLFYGNIIKKEFRGMQVSETGYHPDIPVTICKLSRITEHHFEWGKDLFGSDSLHYAFYTFDNGFGMISDSCFIVYDHNRKEVTGARGTMRQQEELTEKGKALLQMIVRRYIDLD